MNFLDEDEIDYIEALAETDDTVKKIYDCYKEMCVLLDIKPIDYFEMLRNTKKICDDQVEEFRKEYATMLHDTGINKLFRITYKTKIYQQDITKQKYVKAESLEAAKKKYEPKYNVISIEEY